MSVQLRSGLALHDTLQVDDEVATVRYLVDQLGAMPAIDGAAEAWTLASAKRHAVGGLVFGTPYLQGSEVATVLPSDCYSSVCQLAPAVLTASVAVARGSHPSRWQRFKWWSSRCRWEGTLDALFVAWCRAVMSDGPVGNTMATTLPTGLRTTTPVDELRAGAVAVFCTMLHVERVRVRFVHVRDDLDPRHWRVAITR